MAAVETSPKAMHSPPAPDAKRPRGILKNSFQHSPPASPPRQKEIDDKELVIQNTQANAGRRRSSSTASRPAGSRRQSSRASSNAGMAVDADDDDADTQQRLKWDEANLYLTEQERTSTMKITEPKTPYAKHYDPSEDDDVDNDNPFDLEGGRRASGGRGEIPGLSLGEPEEEVPDNDNDGEAAEARRSASKVHVSDEDAPMHDADGEYAGMTPEEREKHRRFEQLRKKHYEMREAVGLLGHPEIADDDEEDDGDEVAPPPVPSLPKVNGTS